VNRVGAVSVSAHISYMDKMNFLITGVALSLLSSCAQNKYIDVQTSEIKHSSPDVISLYENQNEQLRRQENSGGFGSWLIEGLFDALIDGLIGSDPDDNNHQHSDHSSKRKKHFVSKNGDTLRSKLEAKKQ